MVWEEMSEVGDQEADFILGNVHFAMSGVLCSSLLVGVAEGLEVTLSKG